MDQASVVQQIATYFALGTLSEKATLEMTADAMSAYNRNITLFKLDPEVSFIKSSQPLLLKYLQRRKKNKVQEDIRRFLVINDQLDINHWRSFVRKASAEEISIVLFYLVFSMNEAHIARSLNVSEGTIRLRLAKALRTLGGCL